MAGIVAAAMGVISEQFVYWNAHTSALLSSHQRYAILTGLFGLIALALRRVARYPSSRSDKSWSFARSGRGRQTPPALLFLAGADAIITLTASVGGTMVYQYGVGIHGVSYRATKALPPK